MSEAVTTSDPTTPPVISGVVDAVGEGWVQLKVPGTDYRLRLVPGER